MDSVKGHPGLKVLEVVGNVDGEDVLLTRGEEIGVQGVGARDATKHPSHLGWVRLG